MERVDSFSPQLLPDEGPPWAMRVLAAAERTARPHFGWGVLAACMGLSLLPAVALHEIRWLALGPLQAAVDVAGPLAVATIWLLWGWRTPRAKRIGWLSVAASLLIGALVISQLLLRWLPGPAALWQAAWTDGWSDLGLRIVHEWTDAGARVFLWWQGVRMGGAAQENLVFAAIAASVVWCAGLTIAWAARRTRQGYAAGLPSLWLLGIMLLYSTGGRWLLLAGMALTVGLQLMLDHEALQQRWTNLRLDYSPGVLVDRAITVAAVMALVVAVAGFVPNLYVEPLVKRYYEWSAPVNQELESWVERLFPELHGSSRWRGTTGGGLPNDFLLQGGLDLGRAVVLRVRTDEAAAYVGYSGYPYEENIPPPGHYMRGGTFAVYDGRGWRDAPNLERKPVAANEPWRGDVGWGRKRLVQTVIVEASSPILYTVAEPMEVSVDADIETRGENELVAIYGRERSYSVVSAVPAVNEAMLRELPEWDEAGEATEEMADEMAVYLEVPDTVTDRTRELADRILAGQTTPYDRGLAIETYLRQYEYDLNVPDLPRNVRDVADYFLFNIQRGYCDYYATAFVVLARLAGLPARFATGFAVGSWDPVEAAWVVTEAEAHSWPEVYFPEVGWVPFEPTAGRPTLVRVAEPGSSPAVAAPQPAVALPAATPTESRLNWEMAVWIAPLALLVWAAGRAVLWWRRRRENPWERLLVWGRKAGRPISDGETVLEYGDGLATLIVTRQQRQADVARVAAREVQAVSRAVSGLAYGPDDRRETERTRLDAHWQRLRGYLPLVKVR